MLTLELIKTDAYYDETEKKMAKGTSTVPTTRCWLDASYLQTSECCSDTSYLTPNK